MIERGEMQQQALPLAFVHGQALTEKPRDLFIPSDALNVVLSSFEGPLDLLLYLIRKQKFDIVDLPIAEISQQYMHYVELMSELDIEQASEYMVMASILAEIKSRMLLPKPEIEQDEEDPRAELVKRLKEYEVIKNAAEQIDQLPRLERDVLLANVDLLKPSSDKIVPDVDIAELVFAFRELLERQQAFEHHHIQKESLSTGERMAQMLDRLKCAKQNRLLFSNFFNLNEGRHGLVVTFLAMLELVKEGKICFKQIDASNDIDIQLTGASDE